LTRRRLRQGQQRLLERTFFLGIPVTAEHRQLLGTTSALAKTRCRRNAQAIAQGLQQHVVDRALPFTGQRLDALDQQAVDMLHDHIRHREHSI